MLCVVLALYAFAIFDHVSATLATFFVGRDAANAEAELVGAQDGAASRGENVLLRRELRVPATAGDHRSDPRIDETAR